MLSMKASIIQSRVFQSKSGTYENESKTIGTVNWSQLLPNNLNAHIESSVTLDKNIYFKRKVFDQFIINTNDQRMLNGLAKQYYLNRIFKNFIRIVKDWKYEDEQTVEDENTQQIQTHQTSNTRSRQSKHLSPLELEMEMSGENVTKVVNDNDHAKSGHKKINLKQLCQTTLPTLDYLIMKQEYVRMRDFLNLQWEKPRLIDHLIHEIKKESIPCTKYNYSLDKIVQNFDSQ